MIDESNRQSISLVSSGTPRRNKDHTNWTDTEELMESTPIDTASGHLGERYSTWKPEADTRSAHHDTPGALLSFAGLCELEIEGVEPVPI